MKALEPPPPIPPQNDLHQLDEQRATASPELDDGGGEEEEHEDQRGQQQRRQQRHAKSLTVPTTVASNRSKLRDESSPHGTLGARTKPRKSSRRIKQERGSAVGSFNIFLTERVVQSFTGSSSDGHSGKRGGRGGARRRLALSKEAVWHELMSAIAETLQLPAGARNIRALQSIQQARKLPLRPSASMGGLDCRASAVVRPSECLVVETGPAYVLRKDGVGVTQGTAATQSTCTSDAGGRVVNAVRPQLTGMRDAREQGKNCRNRSRITCTCQWSARGD